MTERIVGPRLPELRTLALDLALRTRMKRPSHAMSDHTLRREATRFREAFAEAKTPPFVKVTHVQVGDCPAEWVEAHASAGSASKKVVLYFHGGGFFMSSPAIHRAMTWRMSRACDRRVLALDYRKAPDHAFPAWLDDGMAAYRHLLAEGHAASDIVLSGDSAGGNIALALAHRLKREGEAMPEALVLFSPWADLLCQGKSFRKNARRDAMFHPTAVRALGRYLTRKCNPYDPEVSPAYGDYGGFPRMLILAGSTEVFLDDARTVVQRARAAGAHAELYVYRHMPHVFPMFAGLIPRAKGSFDLVRRFVAGEATHVTAA